MARCAQPPLKRVARWSTLCGLLGDDAGYTIAQPAKAAPSATINMVANCAFLFILQRHDARSHTALISTRSSRANSPARSLPSRRLFPFPSITWARADRDPLEAPS